MYLHLMLLIVISIFYLFLFHKLYYMNVHCVTVVEKGAWH